MPTMKAKCAGCGQTKTVYECIKCQAYVCNPCSYGGTGSCPKCKNRQCMRPTR